MIMHIGARWKYRQWPVEHWIELARRMVAKNISVVVVGAREEEPVVKRIAGSVGGVISVCADMDRLIGLIQGSDLLVCLDSGPMHLAQTLGIPVVALFGPGDFELWHPQGAQDEALFHRLPCNPCLQKNCVRPEDSCMPKITVEEVADAAQRVLDRRLRERI
jgi:ADP-heptose:LPS heptosyltransferase